MPAKLVRRLKTYFVSRRDLHNCRVYRDSDQGIGTGAWVPISFNQQRFDTSPNDNIWLIGNPTQLVCRRAGKYQITGAIQFVVSALGTTRYAGIVLNGVTFLAIHKHPPIGDQIDITTLYELAVGDFVELYVFQDTGGNLNIVSAGNLSPEFMMARVG